MNRKGFSLIELLIVVVIIGIIVIIAVPSLLESKKVSEEKAAQATLRNIASAEMAYIAKSINTAYGTLANMYTQGNLDDRFSTGTATFDGYTFSGTGSSGGFSFTATPDDGDNTNRRFYIMTDGAIRNNAGNAVQ
ncbi:MAG: prepilin-type N-terminal cleavage/methylation domain-containing protein [Acidobacteria bacterium]|nr:prepilin-type N-terminal cleavage/methylation domain-containing protein [Acidobacteriota bacterium]